MPTRRIELNEAVTIKPVMQEKNGRFVAVPGQYAYYTAAGEPLKQDGKVITVQAGDTLVLPANHKVKELDLRYRNEAGQLLGPDLLRAAPAIAVENRGQTVAVSGNAEKLVLNGGNFTMQQQATQLVGVNKNGQLTGGVEPRTGGGFRLTAANGGSITIMPNTRLDITNGRNAVLSVDGDEAAARVRARHADMTQTALKAAGINKKVDGLNPEYTVANTPAPTEAKDRKFPDTDKDIKPDAVTAPAPGQKPAVPPVEQPGMTRPNTPPDRRGGGVVAPPPQKPAGPQDNKPPAQPNVDKQREAAKGIASDLQSIITARGTGADQNPNGRLGFFHDRDKNPDLKTAYDSIVEAQKLADAIAKGGPITAENRKQLDAAVDRAVEAVEKVGKTTKNDNLKNASKEIKERLEGIRTRADKAELTVAQADPRRTSAQQVADDLQLIITPAAEKGGKPGGMLGFFNARNQGNPVVQRAYDSIVEAQKAADAIAKGQADTPDARKNMKKALDESVEAMKALKKGAVRPEIQNAAQNLIERLEKIRDNANNGRLTSMNLNLDGAISPDALTMLRAEQQTPEQPTAENAMSPEAAALLTSTSSNRGNVEDLPAILRTQDTSRQV